MAEIKTNVMRILDKEKVPYEPHYYDVGTGGLDGLNVAAKMGKNPDSAFKTLVTQGASRAYYVFVIPVNRELDLKKCAKAVGEKSVEMIHVNEINKVTGYIRGGCSPLGMKKPYRTTIDQLAQELPTIIVSAGKIGCQVELSALDLARLAGASFADLNTGHLLTEPQRR